MMQSEIEFKKKFTFEERLKQTEDIIKKYPSRIPIFISRSNDLTTPRIDRNKFLVPEDLSLGQFMFVIRKRIKLKSEDAIYLFINNKVPPTSAQMSHLYCLNKSDDGYLYIVYSGESTFG